MTGITDWFRKWWAFLVGAAGLLLWTFVRIARPKPIVAPPPDPHGERLVVEAKAQASKLAVDLGTAHATTVIKEEHAAALDQISEEDYIHAQTLEQDPGALAEHLVRAGRKPPGFGPGTGG